MALDALPDPVVLVALDGSILDCNVATSERVGIPKEDLAGQPLARLWTPEGSDGAGWATLIGTIAGGKAVGPVEVKANGSDESSRRLECRLQPLVDSDGVVAVQAILRDVTDHRRTETSLEETERHFHEALENSGHLLYRLNVRQGRYDYISSCAEELSGYTMDELMAMGLEKVQAETHPDDWRRIQEQIAEARRAQPGRKLSLILEYRRKRKNGEWRWLSDWATIFFDQEGRIDHTIGSAYDITDRKVAEEVLRESHDELERRVAERTAELYATNEKLRRDIEKRRQLEEAYRTVVDHSLQGVLLIQDGQIVFANRAMAEGAGYTLDEIKSMAAEQVRATVHPDDLPMLVQRHLARLRGEPVPPRCVCRGIRKDGSIYWAEVLASRVLYRGRPAIQCVIIDVTEQRHAEEKLRESEQKLAGIIGSVTDHVSMIDETHTIVWANEVAKDLCGRDIEGKKCYAVYHGYTERCDPCVVRRTFEDGKAHEHETEIVDRQGRRKVLWCTANVAARHPDGRAKLVVEVSRDITERKLAEETLRAAHDELEKRVEQRTAELRLINESLEREIAERRRAEQALRESEQHFRSLIENSTDLIVRLDRDGIAQYVSPSFERVLGYRPEELIGKDVFDLIHPEDVAAAKGIFHEGNQIPGYLGKAEFRCRHKDGGWRFVDATGMNLFDDPSVRGSVINARDVTERKRAEEASLVFGRAIEQSRDPAVITDAEGRIMFANKAAERLFGYDLATMQGKDPRDLLRIGPASARTIGETLARQSLWTGQAVCQSRDGTPLTLEATLMLILDERGRTVGAVGFMRDERETRRLESIRQMAEVAAGMVTSDEEAVQRIMSHLPELVNLDQWGIYLHNPEKNVLEMKFCSPAGRELGEAIREIPLSAPLSAQVFGSGEIVFSPDVGSDDRFTKNPDFRKALSTPSGLGMRATCILPLRGRGRIIGTLYLSDRRVRTFTPEELTTLKTLASQIGLLLSRSAAEPSPQPHRSTTRQPAESVWVVAESEPMKLVLRSAQRIARTDMPVVILGPTGAGKGHVANHIHSISPRATGPFLAVNCACLDGELILSELFGHERGAFTGAVRRQKGCFELANGGTLLLDEVVELPLSAQAKLLQLIETQQFRRLGGQQTITTDVRILCTTNADIRECVRSGKMRQDLYYRLNAAELVIPPLRERPEDVRPLALSYLRTQSMTTGEAPRSITEGALARLTEYHWPGNVRELQNVLSLAMSHGGHVIGARELRFAPAEIEHTSPSDLMEARTEREIILEALRRNRWNRSMAAAELGIHRNTLRNHMRKHNITQ
ncbi:MAG: PAS domain S-box protein [Phycisphaerae bacterium]|nr:PAS domain S-box protein [Phycisphaerae bacterium]